MSWFYEDPQRLGDAAPGAFRGRSEDSGVSKESAAMVAVVELDSGYADSLPAKSVHGAGDRNWSRFMDHVFLAFQERRGPFGQTSTGRKGKTRTKTRKAVRNRPLMIRQSNGRSQYSIDSFDLLLSYEGAPRHAMVAFDLTQYICERLQPEPARERCGWSG